MLEGLGFLVALYGLVVLIPALAKLRHMLDIRRKARSVLGTVMKTSSTRNMLAGPLGGTAYRTIIRYQPEKGGALEIWLRDHNLLMSKIFEQGQKVEVVYDAEAPHRAFTVTHWKAAIRDVWAGGLCLLAGGVMMYIGMAFLSPAR